MKQSEPWRESQLIDPEKLAGVLNDPSAAKPFIVSVSPDGMYSLPPGKGIKGSHEFGAAEDQANLDKLKAELLKHDRNEQIVIYCGCCPFAYCPNIRPAFTLLNKMGFKNHKLLNLEHNIMQDWIQKGYPMN